MNMQNERQNKLTAGAATLFIHSIIFGVCCYAGVFTLISPDKTDRPVDVMVYEAGTEPAGSGSSGGAAVPDVDGIVIKEAVHLPELVENYKQATRENPAKDVPMQEKQEQPSAAAKPAVGTDPGNQSSNGSGGTAAEGNGGGSGSGDAAGSGNGNGDDDNKGDGDGRDAEAARRPKTPPVLRTAAQAAYPQAMRSQGREGNTVIRILVGADGQVENAELVSSSGYGELDEAALNAIYNYRFSPALNVYGEPVRCYVRRTIVFRLN